MTTKETTLLNRMIRLTGNQELQLRDAKDLFKVEAALDLRGAASFEQLQVITKLTPRSIHWAVNLLNAELTPAQLYVLPGN